MSPKEMLDVVDEKGIPTGETVERVYAHANGIRHRTSHVWLLRKKEDRVQVLLQKRSANKDSFPGGYDISSAGHIPAGVDFIPSALRELREELGVEPDGANFIDCGIRNNDWDSTFHGKAFHDRQIAKVFALWLDKDEKEFTVQEEEIESVLWMDLDECIEKVKANAFPNCIIAEELEDVQRAIQ